MHDKPAVLVLGGLDATQLAGSELAFRTTEHLVERAGEDEAIAALLERVTFYVIPRASPDACEAFFQKPFCERTTNTRPIDDDNDGRVDEDPPNDLNNDGWITAMRVAEPGGTLVEHPLEPRILVEADPAKGERGRWKRYVEGIDDDGDGQLNEDPPGGVAFNRNFTFAYPYFATGAGPRQVSEPETRAVADFAFLRSNIAAVFTFTAEGNLFHPPKGEPAEKQEKVKTKLLEADARYLHQLAKLYRQLHGGSDAPKPAEGRGSVSDWAYFHYGRWSLAARPWWFPKVEPSDEPEPAGGPDQKAEDEGQQNAESEEKPAEPKADDRGADERRALAWLAREGLDGFVSWQPIEHPDFPGKRVEVGGWKPFVRSNPPAGKLANLATKQAEFLVELAGKLPKLRIDQVEVKPLGGGVWRVKATVTNEGHLPTFPKMGEISKQPQPVQCELVLPKGVRLVTGYARRRLPTLAGGGGQAQTTWLVHVPPGAAAECRLHVWAPAVGNQKKRLVLTGNAQ